MEFLLCFFVRTPFFSESHFCFQSQLPQVRSLSEIAADLCQSTNSLNSSAPSGGGNSISRTNSSISLTNLSLSTNNSAPQLTAEDFEACTAAQRDMYAALKERRLALEEALKKKTEQLKSLCLKEAVRFLVFHLSPLFPLMTPFFFCSQELTGELPAEIPLSPGEPVPQVRRRVGTSFSLSPEVLNRDAPTKVCLMPFPASGHARGSRN